MSILSNLSGGYDFGKCYLKHFPCEPKIGMQFFNGSHKSPERGGRQYRCILLTRFISKSPERGGRAFATPPLLASFSKSPERGGSNYSLLIFYFVISKSPERGGRDAHR